jgi:hypothetical protein
MLDAPKVSVSGWILIPTNCWSCAQLSAARKNPKIAIAPTLRNKKRFIELNPPLQGRNFTIAGMRRNREFSASHQRGHFCSSLDCILASIVLRGEILIRQ